ncbi:hypothetical protein ACLESD_39300 [Pyxidicoccus sp. 3LFB2]
MAFAGLTFGAGCGPEEGSSASEAQLQVKEGDQQAPIDAYLQQANSRGECCYTYCYSGPYAILIGNREKTTGCAEWADDACERRGYPAYDADWGSCTNPNVTWL